MPSTIPKAPAKEGTPGGPTPVGKRVLEQEEFNKKLKAKRALFSKGRSLSLAAFKISVPSVIKAVPKSAQVPMGSSRDEEYLRQNPIKGELDLLNLESLIDVRDVSKNSNGAVNKKSNNAPVIRVSAEDGSFGGK